MGDSDYVIYRHIDNNIEEIFYSESLQYGFNFPYQVGTNGDDPLHAHCESHALIPGDIILVGSDGLWDNLESDDIKGVSNSLLKEYNDEEQLHFLANELAYAEIGRAHV